jgi:hypothetical protein
MTHYAVSHPFILVPLMGLRQKKWLFYRYELTWQEKQPLIISEILLQKEKKRRT